MIFTAAIAGVYSALRRTCPNCGHRQVVPLSKRHESVTCKRCSAAIPKPQVKSYGTDN